MKLFCWCLKILHKSYGWISAKLSSAGATSGAAIAISFIWTSCYSGSPSITKSSSFSGAAYLLDISASFFIAST